MITGKRLVGHVRGDERIGMHRIRQRQRSHESHVAVGIVARSRVRTDRDHFHGICVHACTLEQQAQRHAAPRRRTHRAVAPWLTRGHRLHAKPTVAGAFERYHHVPLWHGVQFFDGYREGHCDGAGHPDAMRSIELRPREIAAHVHTGCGRDCGRE